AAEHVAVDPEVAGLFLRQRVEDVARAERAEHRVGISAAGVVALAAAAIERDALATVAVDGLAQARGAFRNRSVPVAGGKTAVGASAQRRGQAIPVMGIVWNPRGLVAEIALRFRIGTVAAHLGDAALLDQDFDAAIDVAEIAGGLSPFTDRHRGAPIRIALQ